MWGTLEKMATKALAYSTPLGMAWFFILFTSIFRMFVVTVVGGAVCGDETVSQKSEECFLLSMGSYLSLIII